ncbi:MAG: hypothetical protein KDD58_11670 [Bdellovibrionales bacterium]|nr:hypothetical protein [Bdellovibrionales bacterium]
MPIILGKRLSYIALIVLFCLPTYAVKSRKAFNECEKRLNNQLVTSYIHSDINVKQEYFDVYSKLKSILDKLPSRIKEAPFDVHITFVNDYFLELYNFRIQLLNDLLLLKKEYEGTKLFEFLNTLVENLPISDERSQFLLKAFEENKHIQLGVLLNRRHDDDFPTNYTGQLINYLEEITGVIRGFLTELVIGLEQQNVMDISLKVSKHLYNQYSQSEIQKIRDFLGESKFNFFADLEVDVVYQGDGVIYLTEVKNSRQYTGGNQRFTSSSTELIERAKRIEVFLEYFNQIVPVPYKQHFIFAGPGVTQDLANKLRSMGIKVN